MSPSSSAGGDDPAVKWLDHLLPAVVNLSTFGGSITFTVIVGVNAPPGRFGDGTVRTFLAVSWLFFALALWLASVAAMVLAYNRDQINWGFCVRKRSPSRRGGGQPRDNTARRERNWMAARAHWMFVYFPMSLVLQVLIMLAFFFLALVIVAYAEIVGWIAVTSAALFLTLLLLAWSFQESGVVHT